jgi:hypothetical protein
MAACSTRRQDLCHHVYTTVPARFFADSLVGIEHVVHPLEVDIGMVQLDALEEDVPSTIRALEKLPLRDDARLDRIVAEVESSGCRLVVSDIAPLGLVVAGRLGVPGLLVENFTWDWIYRAYRHSALDAWADRMAEIFSTATLRIQTEPVCRRVAGASTVAPVSRARRRSRSAVRSALGVVDDQALMLLSYREPDLADRVRARLGSRPGATIVVPAEVPQPVHEPGLVRVPSNGGLYHPDLVAASDVVIGKLGYSTVAEVYHGGPAFAYLRRPRFPESPVLEAFIRAHVPSAALPTTGFDEPGWGEVLDRLTRSARPATGRPNGADQAAECLLGYLQPES